MENKIKSNYIIFNTKLHVDKILRKIVVNYADNVKLSFNLWKYMPLRMRWALRNKAINFQNNLISFMNKRLSDKGWQTLITEIINYKPRLIK